MSKRVSSVEVDIILPEQIKAKMNTYDTRPAQEKLFFGRQTETAWLIEQLGYGHQLLAICGPRHIGKSALLKELPNLLPDKYLAVYVDAQQVDGRDTSSPLVQIAGEIGRMVGQQTTTRIDPPQAAPSAKDPSSALNDYIAQLAAQLDHRQLVLLIDHAHTSSPEWVHTLLASQVPIVLAAEHREQLSSLLPAATDLPPFIVLGTLDNESAEALVKHKVASRVPIDPWAVRRVLEVTSNHPFYVNVLCDTLFECCTYRAQIMPSEVEDTLEVLLTREIPGFRETWQELQQDEQVILSVFSAMRGQGGIATQYELHKFFERHGRSMLLDDIVSTLDHLVQRGVLERLGTNSYRFRLELFRLWIQENHSPEQILNRRSWSAEPRPIKEKKRVKQWSAWASAIVVMFVFLVVVFQPVFRNDRKTMTATAIRETPRASMTIAASRTLAVESVATEVPARSAMPLPGYDIVYMARVNEDSFWQIYALNSSTGERLRLTETSSNERTPKWSPDGRQIVFASDRDGNREIYVMSINGDRLVNLTQHPAPDWQPAWSPDGTRIAFSSYRDSNWEVYVINADGTNLVRLTQHQDSDFSPTWSPDGSRLLFASRRQGDADLFVIDLDTLELVQLTHSEMDEYDPAWSPDGQWIAFVTQIGQQSDIFVMRADGSGAVNLTNSSYANDFQPVWTRYAEELIFVSYTASDGDHDLFRIRRDGRELARVTDDNVDNLSPCWRSTTGQ